MMVTSLFSTVEYTAVVCLMTRVASCVSCLENGEKKVDYFICVRLSPLNPQQLKARCSIYYTQLYECVLSLTITINLE